MEIIVALPKIEWMIALWQTVMPNSQVITVYRMADKTETKEEREQQAAVLELMRAKAHLPGMDKLIRQQEQAMASTYAQADMRLLGLQSVINMPTGERITKSELAELLGYSGSHAWKENKSTIMTLVSPWMAEHNAHHMIRVQE